MREHGWEVDAWPELFARVLAADILGVAGPIWLGDNSSETKKTVAIDGHSRRGRPGQAATATVSSASTAWANADMPEGPPPVRKRALGAR
jgi:hypothetical protein